MGRCGNFLDLFGVWWIKRTNLVLSIEIAGMRHHSQGSNVYFLDLIPYFPALNNHSASVLRFPSKITCGPIFWFGGGPQSKSGKVAVNLETA